MTRAALCARLLFLWGALIPLCICTVAVVVLVFYYAPPPLKVRTAIWAALAAFWLSSLLGGSFLTADWIGHYRRWRRYQQ